MDVSCPGISTLESDSLPKEQQFNIMSSDTLFEINENIFAESFGELSQEDVINIFFADIDNRKEYMDMEALEFLEEIFNSEEYKNRRQVRDISTQVLPRYLKEFQDEMKELLEKETVADYPLTKYTKEKYKNKLLEEAKIKCKENRLMLENQQKSIDSAKKIILRNTKLVQNKEHKRRNAIQLRGRAETETSVEQQNSKYRLVVISIKKIRRNQIIGKKRRLEKILAKITEEENIKRQVKAMQNKRYDYKVKKREKIIPGMEIVGKQITLKSKFEEVCEETYPEEIDEEEIIEEATGVKRAKKGKKSKEKLKDKKGKGKKSGSKTSTPKGKKAKKEKASKKQKGKKKDKKKGKKKDKKKGGTEEFIMPDIPIINPRFKMKNRYPEDMMELVDINKKYTTTLNNIELERKALFGMKTYEKDTLLACYPHQLIFSNVQNSYVYRKKLSVINTDVQSKKIKLLTAEIHNGDLMEVENFGAYLLVPGLPLTFRVTIFPKQILKQAEGQITFITWASKDTVLKEHVVKVMCLPPTTKVTIDVKDINFGTIKHWKAKNRTFEKKIRIVNNNSKTCHIRIRKVWDSYDFEKPHFVVSENEEVQYKTSNSPVGSGYFSFSAMELDLDGLCGAPISVIFGNIDYVGDYCDKYQIKIYEKDDEDVWDLSDCKDITLSAETIPYFINIEPEVLDFQTTCFDSIYQNKFRIFNTSNLPQRVLVSFPSNLKYYLSCNTPEVIIMGNNFHDIVIKFQPLQNIVENNVFYDKETEILNFPIKISLTSKEDDYPVLKVHVYAIITSNLPLVLKPLQYDNVTVVYDNNKKSCYLSVYCGEISSRESVFIKVGLTNDSQAVHHFGFLNVPEFISISPNYGFGVIGPYQSKILKVIISPESHDVYVETHLYFKLTVTTVKRLGSIKKSFNFKLLRKSMQYMETVIKKCKRDNLENEMINCVEHLRNNDDFLVFLENVKLAQYGEAEFSLEKEISTTASTTNTSSVNIESQSKKADTVRSNTLHFNFKLINCFCKLSHECVVFPNTPCGSYSVMTINVAFKAMEGTRTCGNKYKANEDLARFEVFSTNNLIGIEPKCGYIQFGQIKNLTLIARPEIPQNIIEEKAKQVKKDQIFNRKKQELIEKRKRDLEQKSATLQGKKAKKGSKKGSKKAGKASKSDKSKKKKDKKSKKGSKSKEKLKEATSKSTSQTEEPLPEIVVKDSEVILTPFDLYPAEMILWREFKPYTMQTTFSIKISYPYHPGTEELYLDAICNVTMPNFIHNLDTQHIDFGPTVVGDSKRKILKLRNIKNVLITPEIDKLGTQATFTCPSVIPVPLPSEHILVFPVMFFAKENKDVIEFFEIKSGNTKCPLILSGLGIEPQLTCKPDFLVCRLEAAGEYADFSVEILNPTSANITLTFQKVFELDGEMKELPKTEVPKQLSGKVKGKKAKKPKNKKKGKKSKKSSKTSKSSKSKGKEKIPPTSPELTEDEKYSIENFFERRNIIAKKLFEIVGENKVEILPNSRKSIVIRFGTAPPVLDDKASTKKKDKKNKKGSKKDKKSSKASKGSKKDKKSSKGSKGSKKDKKKGKSKSINDPKTYLAKFNILLGNSTFWRDFIVFGKFI